MVHAGAGFLLEYSWSDGHRKEMQKLSDEYEAECRQYPKRAQQVRRRMKQKLAGLVTRSFSYVAGCAYSSAVLDELIPKRVCANPDAYKGCPPEPFEWPTFLRRLLFLFILVAGSCGFFYLLYSLKKQVQRKENEERLARSASEVRDEPEGTDAVSQAIAHQLREKFYGTSFELWSGGWAYAIMLTWSVLLRSFFPLADVIDPGRGVEVDTAFQLEGWSYFVLMMLLCCLLTFLVHEVPIHWAHGTTKGLTPDRRVRLEFVAGKFSGAMSWLLAISLIYALETSLSVLLMPSGTAAVVRHMGQTANDRQRQQEILGDLSIRSRWFFFVGVLAGSALILQLCKHHNHNSNDRDDSQTLTSRLLPQDSVPKSMDGPIAPRRRLCTYSAFGRWTTNVRSLNLAMAGALSGQAFLRAMNKTLVPCSWSNPIKVQDCSCEVPDGPANVTKILKMKDLNQLACTFDNETLAKELTQCCTDPHGGEPIEPVLAEQKLVLGGSWYVQALWAILVTFLLCYLVVRAQMRLFGRMKLVLSAVSCLVRTTNLVYTHI